MHPDTRVVPLRPASDPPPNDLAIRHWRDRARAAETLAEGRKDLLIEAAAQLRSMVVTLGELQLRAAGLQVDNDRLRSERWFRRTIVGPAAVLLGYAVGVLMR